MGESKRAGLSRSTIIETALRLLNEVGLDGLTVRRLATELGVQSPALYWHFRNKQELLDGMADAIIQAGGMGPPRDGESWQDWLGRRARGYRASLRAHRDGAQVVANARDLSPATVKTFHVELTAMVERGFTPLLALRTITALTHYVNGSVLQEQTDGRRGSPAEPAALAALAERLVGDSSSPLVVAIYEGGSSLGEKIFEHGLRAFIDGTASALTRGARGARNVGDARDAR